MTQYKKNTNKKVSQAGRMPSGTEYSGRRSSANEVRQRQYNRSAAQSSRGSGNRRRPSKKKRQSFMIRLVAIIIVIALVVTGVLAVAGVFRDSSPQEQNTNTEGSNVQVETDENGEPVTDAVETDENGETVADAVPETASDVSLIAVGDVIGHDAILEMAQTDSGYDFTGLFSVLKNDIQKADIAIVNMETPFGGPDVGPYIGYPSFNTPDEMGDALIDAGFDVVQLASNHSMDSGVAGLEHELAYWAAHRSEIMTVGVNESEEAKNTIPVLEKNGIKIAFLNYTYGLNGYEVPAENSYLLTLLTDENADFIRSQIQQAKAEADFVVVLPHWGTEYETGAPNDFERGWAQIFTEAGADLIIGTHPHVIQSIEWIESGGNRALCYYSLGNFVSNQQETESVLGGIAYVKIAKTDEGTDIVEDEAKVIPVVTHNDKTGDQTVIAAHYLSDYSDELSSVHDVKLNTDDSFSVASLQSIADQVWGSDWIADKIDE